MQDLDSVIEMESRINVDLVKPQNTGESDKDVLVRFIHKDVFLELKKCRCVSKVTQAFNYIYKNQDKAFKVDDICLKFDISPGSLKCGMRGQKIYGRVFATRYYIDDMFIAFVEQVDVSKIRMNMEEDFIKSESEKDDASL